MSSCVVLVVVFKNCTATSTSTNSFLLFSTTLVVLPLCHPNLYDCMFWHRISTRCIHWDQCCSFSRDCSLQVADPPPCPCPRKIQKHWVCRFVLATQMHRACASESDCGWNGQFSPPGTFDIPWKTTVLCNPRDDPERLSF